MTAPIIQTLIVTGENFEKVRTAIEDFLPDLPANLRITVASGFEGDPGTFEGTGIETHHFPGDSVFHLRSRMPSLATDCDWVVILEDHNHITRQWFGALREVLATVPDDKLVVVGAASNLTSCDAWSWANFLNTLGFHWAPSMTKPVEPLTFNIAFRRNSLPEKDFVFGQYETDFAPGLMAHAMPSQEFPIDHVQFRTAPEVFKYHWYNGRVTGAFMRRHHPRGLRHVFAHAKSVIGQRSRRLGRILDEHPLAGTLPRGMKWRVRILSYFHAMGAVFGGLTGTGRAPWGLE